ncbi:MAG TPA: response regulator [Acidimicrobiia bacterium]|nr:response regulator [Acidimicrobiia bacterium]
MPPGNSLLAPILVVDDSPANVRLLIRILERGGYMEVTGITDPRSVLDRAKEIAPHLIILDLHMPHADGLAVMRDVRSSLRDVPKFLVVTGAVEEGIRSLALAQGADDVLTKPFQMDDALRRVQLLLERNDDSMGGPSPPR